MKKAKKEKLQKKGWKVGDVDEFLGLSPAEMTIQSGCRISKHCCKEIRLGDCSLDSNFQRNAI